MERQRSNTKKSVRSAFVDAGRVSNNNNNNNSFGKLGLVLLLFVLIPGNAFGGDDSDSNYKRIQRFTQAYGATELTRRKMRDCITVAITGSRPPRRRGSHYEVHENNIDNRRSIGGSSIVRSRSRESCDPTDTVAQDPDDLDPLRFGPGTILPNSDYSQDTIDKFEECYKRYVLDDVNKYCRNPPTPSYSAVSLEVLCCGGVTGELQTVAPTPAQGSFEPTIVATPTFSPTRKRRKTEKKYTTKKRKKGRKQKSTKRKEQALGVRFMQEDLFEEQDAIILDLCGFSTSDPFGHCRIRPSKTPPPTETRPPRPPRTRRDTRASRPRLGE